MNTIHTWSAIAVTAANPAQARAYQHELNLRQKRGMISADTLLLAVPDPSSMRVGSGGATLNALVAVAEHLSARASRTFIDPEVIAHARILVLHSGGDSQRVPTCSVCGKAFSTLPAVDEEGELYTPLDFLLDTFSRICEHIPPGLCVASGDVMLRLPNAPLDWPSTGVTGLAIPAPIPYGPKHGVYVLQNNSSNVYSFMQKGSEVALRRAGAIRPDNTLLLDSGIVYFCSKTTQLLLSLHVTPPLDACTYLGVDNGAIPLRFELYSDILFCMTQQMQKDHYLKDLDSALHQRARELLWESLHGISFQALVAESGEFAHLGTTREYISMLTGNSPIARHYGLINNAQSFIEHPEQNSEAIAINSFLAGNGRADTGVVIEHSELRGNWHLEEGAFCSALRSISGLHLQKNMVFQEITLRASSSDARRFVFTLFGVDDPIKAHYTSTEATFSNRPWDVFFQISGLHPEEIWPGLPENERTLWKARLFPILNEEDWPEIVLWLQYPNPPSSTNLRRWFQQERLSFADIQTQADTEAEFQWQRDLKHKMDLLLIESTLLEKRDTCLQAVLKRCVRENRYDVFPTFDNIAAVSPPEGTSRVFSNIADTLAAFAGTRAGLRSGPARNTAWKKAFDLLEAGDYASAVQKMAIERHKWLTSPEFLMRAARHYEGAAQIIIRKNVETALVNRTSCDPPPIGTWISIDCPARIDLAGGWSDTPPITYEHGGLVVNTAIQVNQQKPIGVKVRRIEEPVIKIVYDDNPPVVCHTLSDMADYTQPLAPGALCKATLLTMEIISLNQPKPLQQHFLELGGGVEIHTRSNLPTGSGLGTSSILAGGLIVALGRAYGFHYEKQSIIHAVLKLEQLLTTGGGWQDQVGGLPGGIKTSHSPASLPLTVETNVLNLPNDFIQTLNNHLLLIYTGRTRLARNLLQDVIRRWYARIPEVVQLVNELTENAERCSHALHNQDLEKLGQAINCYWDQKKRIAGGVEPPHVTRMMADLKPYCLGMSLTGAGGGGFMVVLTNKPNQQSELQAVLDKYKDTYSLRLHDVAIDMEGMTKVESLL